MKNQTGSRFPRRWVLLFFLFSAGTAFSQGVNKSPTIDAIADQALCFTKDYKTILLHGISAGPELTQVVHLTVSTDAPEIFDELQAGPLANNNGYLRYHLQKGHYGTAKITVTVKDDGGTADGGVDVFSRVFTITVYGPPVVSLRSSVITENGGTDPKTGFAISRPQKIQLLAIGAGNDHYTWYPSERLSDPEIANPVFTPAVTTPQKFFVNVSNGSGCYSVDSITVNPVLKESHTMVISAFPNPTRKKSVIKFTNQKTEYVSLNVYQPNGSKVANLFSGNAVAHQEYQVGFTTTGLSAGVYVVRLSSLGEQKSIQLIVTQ